MELGRHCQILVGSCCFHCPVVEKDLAKLGGSPPGHFPRVEEVEQRCWAWEDLKCLVSKHSLLLAVLAFVAVAQFLNDDDNAVALPFEPVDLGAVGQAVGGLAAAAAGDIVVDDSAAGEDADADDDDGSLGCGGECLMKVEPEDL